MAEIWVTPLACSECRRLHEWDDTGEWSWPCDCWCHDDGDWPGEDGWSEAEPDG